MNHCANADSVWPNYVGQTESAQRTKFGQENPVFFGHRSAGPNLIGTENFGQQNLAWPNFADSVWPKCYKAKFGAPVAKIQRA